MLDAFYPLCIIVINIYDVKMSGEGATTGLIGELPPLPLSVLNSPSLEHSFDFTITQISSSFCFFFQLVPSTPLGLKS